MSYYVKGGIWQKTYSGLANVQGIWYYVTNGVLDLGYTGLTDYYTTTYFVREGLLDWAYTGFYESCYVKGGIWQKTYTGLVNREGVWVYVTAF